MPKLPHGMGCCTCFVCLHVGMLWGVCVHLSVYFVGVCFCLRVVVCLWASERVCVCVCVCGCLRVCVYFVCVHLCVCKCLCVCVCQGMCLRVYLCVCPLLCACVFRYVIVSACVCVFVLVCVHMRVRGKFTALCFVCLARNVSQTNALSLATTKLAHHRGHCKRRARMQKRPA